MSTGETGEALDSKVYNSALDAIGHTPLIRLARLEEEFDLKCRLFAKCEFFNAGGSVKDRVALRMIEEAERAGKINSKSTIIEPTSGNTGIGLALACAIKKLRCIIVMPEKMSKEKVDVLLGLGAEVVRTPTSAAFNDPESHISVARRLEREIEGALILDQYTNKFNPKAHYETTANEIISAIKSASIAGNFEGGVDLCIVGAGTGGTVTGIAKRLKEIYKNIQIIGVDPKGSILADLNAHLGAYKVEGIGYDFVPETLNRSIVDRWITTEDKESFQMARKLIRVEGLLVGGSSGAALHAAIKDIQERKDFSGNCVVILPDGVRNYMSKFLNDDWMVSNGFSSVDCTVNAKQFAFNPKKVEEVCTKILIGDAQLFLRDSEWLRLESGKFISKSRVVRALIKGEIGFEDSIDTVSFSLDESSSTAEYLYCPDMSSHKNWQEKLLKSLVFYEYVLFKKEEEFYYISKRELI